MNPYLPSKHDPTMKPIPSMVGTVSLQVITLFLPILCLSFMITTAMIIAHKHDKSLADLQTRISMICHFIAYLILGCAMLSGCGVAMNVLSDMIDERLRARRNFNKGTYYKTGFMYQETESNER